MADIILNRPISWVKKTCKKTVQVPADYSDYIQK